MKVNVLGFMLLFAFVAMLSAKVFDLGIGYKLSWWVVTSPIWGPFALVAVVVIGFLTVAGVSSLAAYFAHNKEKK